MPLFKGSPGLHYARHSGDVCETALDVTCKDSQLYNAVVTGNTEASLSLVNQLMSDQYGIAGLEQRYYYARMPLLLAQNALGAQAVPSPPDYSSACLPDWLCGKLCEFAGALCNCVIRKCKYSSSAEKQDKDFLVYIHEHFCEDSLSVKTISEACGVHEKTLNIECRVSTGMNISAYIQQLRLDKASSMLRNTDIKVLEVLKECGYNTPNAFYKAFKKAHGNSPSEYRDQFRSA